MIMCIDISSLPSYYDCVITINVCKINPTSSLALYGRFAKGERGRGI